MSQTLVLAPQLQQSLALLQAPVLELKALIERELEQNPVLEEVPASEPDTVPAIGAREKAADKLDPAEPPADVVYDTAAERDGTVGVDDFETEFNRLAQLDDEWREDLGHAIVSAPPSAEDEEKRQFMFDSITADSSLHEFLLEQVRLSDIPAEKRPIAELIVGNIDDYGYLTASVEELAATASAQLQRNVPVELVLEVLKEVQTFDPPGVGARDLRECLLLQLERAGLQNSLEYKIVSEHFEALGKRRVPEIAKALGVSKADVQEAMERISRLDPRPGRQYAPDNDQYVVPEVFVTRSGDDFVVTLNNEQIPRLRISNTYKELMSRSAVDIPALESAFKGAPRALKKSLNEAIAAIKAGEDPKAVALLRALGEQYKLSQAQSDAVQHAITQVMERRAFIEARNYIREKIRAGKFLIKSIEQRQQTILNIAKEIVKRQREFMEKGVAYLKPMTMSQIAQAVGVHETTVSRAVAGKYMQTPQGIFEMKFFFTTGIQTATGEGVSNTSVKDMIAEIFKNEDPTKPLSDQEVVKMLREKGVMIARRTVAKYRSELGILPSNLRKVY
ncbi:MAG: RNA polymerase sigma-54 factor [Verrucomicrobiales bacterium]|nr:RNA polymerase sigma-54 factor [Verrucomicrobiales bacterium]